MGRRLNEEHRWRRWQRARVRFVSARLSCGQVWSLAAFDDGNAPRDTVPATSDAAGDGEEPDERRETGEDLEEDLDTALLLTHQTA